MAAKVFYKTENIGLGLASIEELRTVTPQNQHIIKKDMAMVSLLCDKEPNVKSKYKGSVPVVIALPYHVLHASLFPNCSCTLTG